MNLKSSRLTMSGTYSTGCLILLSLQLVNVPQLVSGQRQGSVDWATQQTNLLFRLREILDARIPNNKNHRKLNYNFSGKFLFENSTHLDEFLEELGVGYLRKLEAYQATPSITIRKESTVFYNLYFVDTVTTFMDAPFSFQEGIEFTISRLEDTDEVKSVIDIYENVWRQRVFHEPSITIEWTFTGDDLKIVSTVKEVTMIRFYKKEKTVSKNPFSMRNVFGAIKEAFMFH